MKKQEVIRRLCALVTEVGREVFAHKYAHDCFCDAGVPLSRAQYNSYVENDTNIEKYKRVAYKPQLDCCNVDLTVVDERIIKFIEDAVLMHIGSTINIKQSLPRDHGARGHIPPKEE